MKKLIPIRTRLKYKLVKRFCSDVLKGHYYKFAVASSHKQRFAYKLSLSQPIKRTTGSINKVENIKIAYKKIEKVIIYPGELFSFWRIVGEPNKSNGFKKGRNLIAGVLKEDYGGGLCQLSGMIYHLSLLGNLEIVERFNHTIDIYTDETRYTPLGSDATIVYGYKDLRIKNNYGFPITFQFKITNDALYVELLSTESIEKQKIEFVKSQKEDQTKVSTLNGNEQLIACSYYN